MRLFPIKPYVGSVEVELTRRNLEVLLAKLDDPMSSGTLISPPNERGERAIVRAVENEEHYSDRDPGPMLMNGEVM